MRRHDHRALAFHARREHAGAGALLPEKIRGSSHVAIENDVAERRGAKPHLRLSVGEGDARLICSHQKGGDAPPAGGRVGDGKDHSGVGDRRQRDVDLLTVQHP